ncbi:MAG: preprotein translocase subunit SecE [Pseudobdellovibrionaceae bacterium]
MDKTNSKVVTVSFALFAMLICLSMRLLLKAFAGAFSLVARATDADLVRHGMPVLIGLGLFLYLQFTPKVLAWADEVISEIKKITWASKKDTYGMTVAVVVMVTISGIVVALFDYLSAFLLNTFIR